MVRASCGKSSSSLHHGCDARYVALLAKAKGNPDLYALRMVYLLQGLLAFSVSAPIQVGAFERGSVQIIGWIGVALWALGVFFEVALLAFAEPLVARFSGPPLLAVALLVVIGLQRAAEFVVGLGRR